jgi:hypothetical protein
MVGARGIEPLTPSMSRKCSTAELSARMREFSKIYNSLPATYDNNGKFWDVGQAIIVTTAVTPV